MTHDDSAPRFTTLGSEQTDTHLLTHANWCPAPYLSSRGSNETGVRSVVNGQVQDDFFLIQHGWYDWQKAAEVIKRLLSKGRSPRQVADVMGFMRERGWVNRPPRATIG
jgi:hypothetical protein